MTFCVFVLLVQSSVNAALTESMRCRDSGKQEITVALMKAVSASHMYFLNAVVNNVNYLISLRLHSYDECVGPGSTQIYIPTDDPPPYSLLDPCQRGAEQDEQPGYASRDASPYRGQTSASAAWFSPSHYPPGLQEQEHQHIASISFPLEAAPPYELVFAEQGQPLPLMPCDLYKHQSERRDDGNSQQPGANQIL